MVGLAAPRGPAAEHLQLQEPLRRWYQPNPKPQTPTPKAYTLNPCPKQPKPPNRTPQTLECRVRQCSRTCSLTARSLSPEPLPRREREREIKREGKRARERERERARERERVRNRERVECRRVALDLTMRRRRLGECWLNNYFTEMCSGSEASSYLRLIDFCITHLQA